MKKSYSITIVIVGILMFVSYSYIFIKAWKKEDDMKSKADKLQIIMHERDSLALQLRLSVDREKLYIIKAKEDSAIAANALEKAEYFESKTMSLNDRIKQINKIQIARPDSFLIKRYPN